MLFTGTTLSTDVDVTGKRRVFNASKVRLNSASDVVDEVNKDIYCTLFFTYTRCI